MPSPDYLKEVKPENADIFKKHFEQLDRRNTQTESTDISELKKEISEIKKMLTPSIILTGQSVIDEYYDLTKLEGYKKL